MNEDRYFNVRSSADYRAFLFASEGRHGVLTKIVSFYEVAELESTFNLALGTLMPDGEIDFDTFSNNGDRNKVLRTVAEIVRRFIEYNPGKRVYITGSDPRRTLLYQRAITYGYNDLIKMFVIYGDIFEFLSKEKFEIFDSEKNYPGFLIEQKID